MVTTRIGLRWLHLTKSLQLVIALALFVAACASGVTLKNADRFAQQGDQCAQGGRFEEAAWAYGQAIQRATLGGADEPYLAHLLAAYGQSAALSGSTDEGVSALEAAVAKYDALTDERSRGIGLAARAALARVLFDNARYGEALPVFDDIAAAIDPSADDVVFAADSLALLAEGRTAAERVGDAESGQRFRALEESLRASGAALRAPGPRLRFTPEAVAARR